VRLRGDEGSIAAEVGEPVSDWKWLVEYLQIEIDLEPILESFPKDSPMSAATAACRGLRLLRQEPWECLASFILSSTKQIVQIQQIIALLCERFGERIPAPTPYAPAYAFPTAARLAEATEADLRGCKMGFRAPYLLETALIIARQEVALSHLCDLPVETARNELMRLPGVGRKIADCVLLFAYGFQSVFPVDVWITKALRKLYFPNRRPNLKRLHNFASNYFGPYSGYAQQYLFHYMRTKAFLKDMPNSKPRNLSARNE
jgi:N-glycosylase/DNA lyase